MGCSGSNKTAVRKKTMNAKLQQIEQEIESIAAKVRGGVSAILSSPAIIHSMLDHTKTLVAEVQTLSEDLAKVKSALSAGVKAATPTTTPPTTPTSPAATEAKSPDVK